MKVKELPPVIAQEISIFAGRPLEYEKEDRELELYEICNYGPFDEPQHYLLEDYTKQTQVMWSAMLEEYGEQEVIAIESDYDGKMMIRLYIKGGHS